MHLSAPLANVRTQRHSGSMNNQVGESGRLCMAFLALLVPYRFEDTCSTQLHSAEKSLNWLLVQIQHAHGWFTHTVAR